MADLLAIPGRASARDGSGYATDAEMAACGECGCALFRIFTITTPRGRHEHIQCGGCETSYCDNTCHEELKNDPRPR